MKHTRLATLVATLDNGTTPESAAPTDDGAPSLFDEAPPADA